MRDLAELPVLKVGKDVAVEKAAVVRPGRGPEVDGRRSPLLLPVLEQHPPTPRVDPLYPFAWSVCWAAGQASAAAFVRKAAACRWPSGPRQRARHRPDGRWSTDPDRRRRLMGQPLEQSGSEEAEGSAKALVGRSRHLGTSEPLPKINRSLDATLLSIVIPYRPQCSFSHFMLPRLDVLCLS